MAFDPAAFRPSFPTSQASNSSPDHFDPLPGLSTWAFQEALGAPGLLSPAQASRSTTSLWSPNSQMIPRPDISGLQQAASSAPSAMELHPWPKKPLTTSLAFSSDLTLSSSATLLSVVESPVHPMETWVMESTTAKATKRICKFCKRNGSPPDQYQSHTLRSPGNDQLTCPVLRSHTCSICGATGDSAHTIKYCPQAPYYVKVGPKETLYGLFRKTPHQADGRLRRM